MTIKVLVVDDSAFMRRAITKMIESQSDIRVVGTASSGEEAIAKAEQLKPDVVTMDVEMPGIGGLEAVKQIAARGRVPIVMLSALTQEGAETTFRALELGAVDFVAKPNAAYTNIRDVAGDLVAKIRTFSRGAHPLAGDRPLAAHRARSYVRARTRYECVAIGASTGGPVALSHIIPMLPADYSLPVIVVQHMPVGFTRPLADRLNAQSKLRVSEAVDGTTLKAGSVLVIPSGRQPKLSRKLGEVELRLITDDSRSVHVPSVDMLQEQVADAYGSRAIGVILTGMGHDGVKGLRRLKSRGGYVIGQDEHTSVVYGMPRAAADAGLVDRVTPLDEIAYVLSELGARSNQTNS